MVSANWRGSARGPGRLNVLLKPSNRTMEGPFELGCCLLSSSNASPATAICNKYRRPLVLSSGETCEAVSSHVSSLHCGNQAFFV